MVAQIGRQDRRESSEQNRGILCVERVLLFLLQERRLLSYCRRCLTWQGRIQRGGGGGGMGDTLKLVKSIPGHRKGQLGYCSCPNAERFT